MALHDSGALRAAKSEARSTKSETNSNLETQMFKTGSVAIPEGIRGTTSRLRHSDIVSDFDIRISDSVLPKMFQDRAKLFSRRSPHLSSNRER